jgi:hypothetical protein
MTGVGGGEVGLGGSSILAGRHAARKKQKNRVMRNIIFI